MPTHPPPPNSQALDQAHRLRRQLQRQILFNTEQERLRLKEREKFKKGKAKVIAESSNDPQELVNSPKPQEQPSTS